MICPLSFIILSLPSSTSLCRIEARAVKAILVGIMKDHPQAIYYSLRSFYLERRDIERSTAPKATPPNDDDTLTSSRLAEELMSNLRKVHPVLWSRLESILEDLIVRFRPSYEAELMHSISALLEKASKPEYKTSKDSKDSGTEISGHLDACTKTLHLLGTKFFNLSKEKPDSAITRKAALFQSKYCDEFKRDFLLEKEGLKCDDLVAKLHKWKKLLERGISRVPKTSSLQEVSPSLSWFSCQAPDLWAGACESMSLNVSNSQHDAHSSLDNTLFHAKRSSALAVAKASSQAVLVAANAEGIGGHSGAAVVEIPGQYAPTSSSILDSRPIPELHAKLVRFHQTLELTSSSTKQHVHQITMIGSDGKMYKFLLQLAIPYWIRTDERSAQVKYVIRKTLRRDYRACRRSLTIRPSVVIPVAQRMRMSANQSSHESLDSIFCSVQGPKTNMLPAYFQEKVTETAALRVHALGESERDNDAQVLNQVKLDVYHDICHKLVLPNVLSKYMSRMISSTEHLYRFRHVFSSQLAANSLLQYALAIVERTPNRFAFCNASGQMISQDFRSQYNHGAYSVYCQQETSLSYSS
jgi:transformation/transcription domain-associated protein